MAVFLQPIYTQTVGSGGASTITFNNIPQTFTDLMVFASARTTQSATDVDLFINFNNDSSGLYSTTRLYGGNSSPGSSRSTGSGAFYVNGNVGSTATASTFGSAELYLPNYTNSNYKSVVINSVDESNSNTNVYAFLNAGLYRGTNPVTRIDIGTGGGGSFVQYCTFSLYGILRSGV